MKTFDLEGDKAMVKKLAAAVAALSLAAAGAYASDEAYSTSFETPTFSAGPLTETVDGWELETGSANIVSEDLTSEGLGMQHVNLGAGAILNRQLRDLNPDGAETLWVEGHFRGQGSSTTLSDAIYDMSSASAIVHFSMDNGIELGDGNGEGGMTATASGISSLNPQAWYRITIRLNFTDQMWDVWISGDGQNVSQTGLGFIQNGIDGLNGFKNLAQDSADFDAFRVVFPVLGDANGDAQVDSADVVAVVDGALSQTSNPIVFGNGDVNADGILDATDQNIIRDLILDRN